MSLSIHGPNQRVPFGCRLHHAKVRPTQICHGGHPTKCGLRPPISCEAEVEFCSSEGQNESQGGDESLKQPIFNIPYQYHSYVLRLKYLLSTTLKVSEGHLMNLSSRYINCRSYTWGTLCAQVRCLLGKPCNSFAKYVTLLLKFLKKSHKLHKLTKPTSANCFQPDTAAFVVHPDQRPRARHSGVMPLMLPSQAPAESGHLCQWQRCKVRKVLAATN